MTDPDRRFGHARLALALIGVCVALTAVLSIADRVLRAKPGLVPPMLSIWVMDFKYLFESCILPATIVWVGARLLDARTLLTVGFDRMDAHTMVVRGPDGSGVVWIGRRYGSRLEAEIVAAALQSRLDAERGP